VIGLLIFFVVIVTERGGYIYAVN